MSGSRLPSQPDDMLRRLGSQVVPVEDPERVERRRAQVVAALARSIRATADRKRRGLRTRLIWSLGIAATLALGIGIAAQVRQRSTDASAGFSTVSEVTGAVVVTENGESRVLSRDSESALRSLGEIETAPEARATIRSQKSVVQLASATKLSVPRSNAVEERYRLAVGRVEISVDKDSRIRRNVVVETPNAEVVVHGTVFAVGVASRNQRTVTDVSVSRGSVWVLQHGVQVALLGAGEHWSSDSGPAGPSLVGTVSPPVAPPVTVDTASAPHEATPHETMRRRLPLASARAAAAEAKASSLAEQSRMFQEAIDARNRGEDARAAELFARLLTRYPSYEEAEVQLFRAQKRLGRTTAAAAEARRYLAQHPQGFARDEARDLALSSLPGQRR